MGNLTTSFSFHFAYFQTKIQSYNKQMCKRGGSPGLVVMRGDSCTEGGRFESQHHKLDGHFFTYICCKIIMFVWNFEIKTKKSLGMAHFLKTNEKKILPVSGSGIQTHNLSKTSLLQQPLDHCWHPFFSYVYRSFPFLFPISFDFDSLISVFPFSVSAIMGGEEVPNGGNGATQNLKN